MFKIVYTLYRQERKENKRQTALQCDMKHVVKKYNIEFEQTVSPHPHDRVWLTQLTVHVITNWASVLSSSHDFALVQRVAAKQQSD